MKYLKNLYMNIGKNRPPIKSFWGLFLEMKLKRFIISQIIILKKYFWDYGILRSMKDECINTLNVQKERY